MESKPGLIFNALSAGKVEALPLTYTHDDVKLK
jgi:hypothetical protein